MDENSETNEDGGTRTSSQKTAHLKWTNTLNFKELEKYENLSRPKHSLAVGSSEKDFFELFVTNDFYNKVAEETTNIQLYHKENRGQWITSGKTQMRKKSNPILEFGYILVLFIKIFIAWLFNRAKIGAANG